MSDKPAEAGLNQVFICRACSRCFRDRQADHPMEIAMKNVFASQTVMVPHAKYPNDPDLATKTIVSVEFPEIVIAGRAALECCADHTVLCSGTRIRFADLGNGQFEVVGAEYLE